MLVINYGLGILFGLFILFLFVAFCIRVFFYVVTVEGPSMFPTLNHMDRILVLRHWPSRWLKQGQIVIGHFWDVLPEKTEQPSFIIKRIVGLPNETVTIELPEVHNHNFLISSNQHWQDTKDGNRIWHIPKGYCFLRGDNKQMSTDSIFWGPVPLDSISGIMLVKLHRKINNSEEIIVV